LVFSGGLQVTNSNGPRQFWIRHESIIPGYGCKTKHAFESEQTNSLHVIEYSAYESLQAELAECQGKLQPFRGVVYKGIMITEANVIGIIAHAEELKAKAEKLVEALKIISLMDSPMGFAGCPEVARDALEDWQS
jgi:hypothetical protein